MSNTLAIVMDQGSTLNRTYTLVDDLINLPLDITNYQVRCQVRRSFGGEVLINGTLANGKVSIIDAQGGRIQLLLQPNDTANIRFSADNKDAEQLDAVYDIEVVSTEGTVFKPARGAFVIKREVTR